MVPYYYYIVVQCRVSVSSGAGLQDLLQPWWETGGVLAPDPAAYWVKDPSPSSFSFLVLALVLALVLVFVFVHVPVSPYPFPYPRCSNHCSFL